MAKEDDVTNFVIGIFVSLAASFMDALGLNILKLDHVRAEMKEAHEKRGDCGRPLWHIGLYTYIASQLIGSTIALNYLKTQWVAPLGSVALIYNFIFAKILVGTKITRKDVLGTFVVIASVIWIVVFGGMYNGDDPEESISLENLKTLFVRPIFIIYFSALNIITLSGMAFAVWSRWALADDARKRRNQLFSSMKPKKMRRLIGLLFSLVGGMLASETLLLAKSGVKLFTLSVSSQVNQFTDNTSRFILLALLLTAIMQVYCLNSALKLYNSVVVVPVFYGTYTALGLVNTIIYLDEIGNYPGWAIALVFGGIGALIYGVFLLSSKPDLSHPIDNEEEITPDQEMNILNLDSSSWPTAKEEKEAASARLPGSLGEASGSHQQLVPPTTDRDFKTNSHLQPTSRVHRWLARIRHVADRRSIDHSNDTFIGLQTNQVINVTIPVPSQIDARNITSDATIHQQEEILRHRHSCQPSSRTSDSNLQLHDGSPLASSTPDSAKVKP
ncbi:uncharacterized protein BYT42DRAFT_573821 [Radiomyces spectabilis]|uniref:uncharacterized protein n=1 Tax=Radiomyces spectabilis TaxID=64574 RepID=UPI00221FBA3E|nr:uncharacterized protein BYT42DRAFT_573821 [Radiomyces spectabilis]KAI8376219.1 hypothetical protein BYT42DRAFT_573821 [Radiomyces spectabilis]